jgi:hypothetical protein
MAVGRGVEDYFKNVPFGQDVTALGQDVANVAIPVAKGIGKAAVVATKGVGVAGAATIDAASKATNYFTGAGTTDLATPMTQSFNRTLNNGAGGATRDFTMPPELQARIDKVLGVSPKLVVPPPAVSPSSRQAPTTSPTSVAGIGDNTVYSWKDKRGRETLTNVPSSIPAGVKSKVVLPAHDFGVGPDKSIADVDAATKSIADIDAAINAIKSSPGNQLNPTTTGRGMGLTDSATAQIVELEKTKAGLAGHKIAGESNKIDAAATAEDRAGRLAETKRYNDIRAEDVDLRRKQDADQKAEVASQKKADATQKRDEAYYKRHVMTDLNPETQKPEPNDTLTFLRMAGSGEPVPERFQADVAKAMSGFEDYYKRGLTGPPNPADRETAWRKYWKKFRRFSEPAK